MLHYIITNRQILKNAKGVEYIKEDGGEMPSEELRFGTFDSSVYNPKLKNCSQSITIFPDITAPQATPAVPVNQPQLYSQDMLQTDTKSLDGSKRFFSELFHNMQAIQGDLLFFIHGFHTDLPGALQSICDLEAKYINANSPIKHIVSFTWPAMDKLLRYRDDAKDAELSGFTLARCYLMMIDFFRAIFASGSSKNPVEPCGNNIHLLAHSMGNRVLENMMIELLSQQGDDITAVFKEIILAASDVDWQVFEQPRSFNKLTNICQRVTVYYNTKDLALFISETTKNSYNRLGKFGFRNYNEVPAHVYSVDCSGIKDESGLETKLVQHWYYKESPKVVNDITQVLKGKRIEDLINVTRTAIPSVAIQFRLMV